MALTAFQASAETLSNARYVEPVERYGHFALGRPHEYAAVTVTARTGEPLTLRLGTDEVFEDVAPRVVRLGPNEPEELLVIISHRKSGSRLALLGHISGRLEISAQSAPVGIPMRWLNPVGLSDLDGDGHAEIAAVITPHIGGTLKVYRRVGSRLVEHASLDGFSNHTYGAAEQRLSLTVTIAGRSQLLVPDTAKQNLRLIALSDGRLVESARCHLASPLIGPLQLQAQNVVRAFTAAGWQTVELAACQKSPA